MQPVTLFPCVQPGESSLWKAIEEPFIKSAEKSFSVADRLLTSIGCCLGANHLTRLHPYLCHFSQPCLPWASPGTEERSISTAWKMYTFAMTFWADLQASNQWVAGIRWGPSLARKKKRKKRNQTKSHLSTVRP